MFKYQILYYVSVHMWTHDSNIFYFVSVAEANLRSLVGGKLFIKIAKYRPI